MTNTRLFFSLLYVALIVALLIALTDIGRGQGRIETTDEHRYTQMGMSIYCHLCDSQMVIKLLPADFRLSPNERLQWTPEKEDGRGRLALIYLQNPGNCPPNVRVIWQSKTTTLEKAVKQLTRRNAR